MDTESTVMRPFVPQTGHWLPENHDIIHHWLSKLVSHVDAHPRDRLDPVIQEFQDLIDNNAVVRKSASLMFTQVPTKPPYNKDPTKKLQVRDYHHMFALFNEILQTAPVWNQMADDVGLIGFPISAIIDWPMGTQAGDAFFLRPDVNQHFQAILNKWGEFLKSPQSNYVLTRDPGHWFSPEALQALEDKGNHVSPHQTHYTFEQLYVCDPSDKHFGFSSWDRFFTRSFRDNVRPIAGPDDSSVIVNACESAPWKFSTKVKERDKFWLKAQPYSLFDMMANDDLAPQFAGGTVYQAFLNALSYHRWHSPVDGSVVKWTKIPGTYYSENKGFPDPDPAAPNKSQGYIAEVSTRSIIFIEADNKDIGLLCLIHIGMAEVSSCEYTVQPGDRVKKGQEIGMFHYGGSTHCLIFRPQVQLKWAYEPPYDNWNAGNIAVNSLLATVVAAK